MTHSPSATKGEEIAEKAKTLTDGTVAYLIDTALTEARKEMAGEILADIKYNICGACGIPAYVDLGELEAIIRRIAGIV